MMRVGTKSTLISFAREASVQDEYGEEIAAWSSLGNAWAAINWGRGDERRQVAMERGSQSATFTVYDNSMTRTLTIRDRIAMDGLYWDIESNVPSRDGFDRDITAVRAT